MFAYSVENGKGDVISIKLHFGPRQNFSVVGFAKNSTALAEIVEIMEIAQGEFVWRAINFEETQNLNQLFNYPRKFHSC